MTETEVRAAIMTVIQQIQQDWTNYTLVVEPEERAVVDQTQENPYLKIWIDFLKAEQLDLGTAPRSRQLGQIHLQVVVRCGKGTAAMAALRDFIRPYLNLKNLAGVQCFEAELYKGQEIKGWAHYPILVNFSYMVT